MKIVWASNYMGQFTGYGTIARNLLPKIQKRSDHEMIHFAVSGLTNVPPFMNQGVKVYGTTSSGGNLGVYDLPVVRAMEEADLVHLNYDVWATHQIVQQYDFNFTLYPPVDHDPLPMGWINVLKKCAKVVPYCKFGERVMKEGMRQMMDEEPDIKDIFYEPIYHGVNTSKFKPMDVDREELFNRDDDNFIVMMNKNNQGTRAALERQIRAYKIFIQDPVVDEDKCLLFINSNIQGSNAFDLGYVISRLDLQDYVRMVNQNRRRYGLSTEELAELYNASDVILNCTRGEGFGLPIIEAFACGKPVIATGYSSMPELLNDEEGEFRDHTGISNIVTAKRGILIPTHDEHMTLGKHSWRREVHTRTIATALKYAYLNQDEMAEKGKEAHKWVQQYDWSNIADQWVDFFDYMEEYLFTEDDDGVQWEKISKEKGGVGAFGKK